jgi:glycine/D-amino acid oxidase-like deaminating enzyme
MDGTHVLVGGDSYDADNVVLAMGPWMHDVLDVPLHIKRKVVAWYDIDAEAFLDIQTGFYGIPGNGVKIGRHYGGRLLASPDDAEGAFTPEDAEQFAGVDTYIGEADRTDHRICYYTMTLDEDFIIDRVDVDVVVAAGFSGRGFKYAPAVARLVHDLVEGAEPVRAFRLDRFKNT